MKRMELEVCSKLVKMLIEAFEELDPIQCALKREALIKESTETLM